MNNSCSLFEIENDLFVLQMKANVDEYLLRVQDN